MKCGLSLSAHHHANELSFSNVFPTQSILSLFSNAAQSLLEHHMQQVHQFCSVNHAMVALEPSSWLKTGGKKQRNNKKDMQKPRRSDCQTSKAGPQPRRPM